jgi:threonyl-tRNA synthetase
VLAMAVQELYPKAQVTIGPWIEHGFYYDFNFAEPFTAQHLTAIKQKMDEIIKANIPVVREEVSREEARRRIEVYIVIIQLFFQMTNC